MNSMIAALWWDSEDSDHPPFDVDALESRPRCEADHRMGGVCQRLLTPAGVCPGEADHAGVAA